MALLQVLKSNKQRGGERMAYNTWHIEIKHEGLGKYRLIKGPDKATVEERARAQRAIWDEQWERKVATAERAKERIGRQISKHMGTIEELTQTANARAALDEIRNILITGSAVKFSCDWEKQKITEEFKEPQPTLKATPKKPNRTDGKYSIKAIPENLGLLQEMAEPKESDKLFSSNIPLLTRLFSSKAAKQSLVHASWKQAHEIWKIESKKIELHNASIIREHEQNENARLDSLFSQNLDKWEIQSAEIERKNLELSGIYLERKEAFYAAQQKHNIAIDAKHVGYLSHNVDEVAEYCEAVLSASKYPESFPKEWDLDYNSDSKLLLVDFCLPNLECIPTLREVKYMATKGEFKEIHLSAKELNELYDSLLYQVTLRNFYELFSSDAAGALISIVFNGYVRAVEKSSGNEVTTCILSVQAEKDEFLAFNLQKINPKECFKSLKGVGSSKLHGITAIAPLARIDKNDRRFVESHDVAIDTSTNLAAMDWEDFEHLIRELFEKEFASGGGEVRVTQASRDGGVDAIIFDPDLIRGGKIVVQAKRYTNVVGVSAVRDLYGTMMNEGAMKGILVTTSNYGPDSYEFAKDKPLTLLSGANLLHLLEQHGHRARINIAEARLARAFNSPN